MFASYEKNFFAEICSKVFKKLIFRWCRAFLNLNFLCHSGPTIGGPQLRLSVQMPRFRGVQICE